MKYGEMKETTTCFCFLEGLRVQQERDDGETERAAEESQIKVALGEKVGRNLKHFHSARVCARACDTELCCPFPLSPRQNGRARRVCSVTYRCLSARR